MNISIQDIEYFAFSQPVFGLAVISSQFSSCVLAYHKDIIGSRQVYDEIKQHFSQIINL